MASPKVRQSLPCGPLLPRHQARKKRSRSIEKSSQAGSKPKAVLPKNFSIDGLVDKNIDSPVDFLKALFSVNDRCRESIQHRHFTFTKPTEAETDAYDLEVVRAIREGNLHKLRGMLKEGKEFDACNKFGESLIHMACRRGDVKVVRFLIEEAKVKVDRLDDFARTILHDALWTPKPNLELMKLLLTKVPPSMLLASDARGHTPFHYARQEHWAAWTAFLREHAATILQRLSLLKAFQLVR